MPPWAAEQTFLCGRGLTHSTAVHIDAMRRFPQREAAIAHWAYLTYRVMRIRDKSFSILRRIKNSSALQWGQQRLAGLTRMAAHNVLHSSRTPRPLSSRTSRSKPHQEVVLSVRYVWLTGPFCTTRSHCGFAVASLRIKSWVCSVSCELWAVSCELWAVSCELCGL